MTTAYNDKNHSPATRLRRPGLSATLLIPLLPLVLLHACELIGIEPDEIDIAEGGEASADAGETGPAGTGEAEEPSGEGDGDGDEAGAGEGDGDGESEGESDGDQGGDGDGDPALSCADFTPTPLSEGANEVELLVVFNNFEGTCGGVEGPDAVYSYAATASGTFSFELSEAEFAGVVYAVEDCLSLEELGCELADVALELELIEGQTVYIIVDSLEAGVGGAATLTVSPA